MYEPPHSMHDKPGAQSPPGFLGVQMVPLTPRVHSPLKLLHWF